MTAPHENLGPAEKIIQALLNYSDHCVHNRPGLVVADQRFNVGVRWEPVTYRVEEGKKVVYKLEKVGKRSNRTRVGTLREDGKIMNGGRAPIGEYREAGLFPEVVAWFYRQVAEVWKLDNEFAARWASYAFAQEHRDLKVVLAAFMLVQNRKGDPVLDGGKIVFCDEDYRDVGEAMTLLYRKDGKDLSPKLLLRIHDVLTLPAVAEINRELGFGKSARHPFLGRWSKAVEKWLRYREDNPRVLDGLVKAGFRTTVIRLAQLVGYKPESPKFFEALRWKQAQAKDGRRTMVIGQAVKAAETWESLTEEQICKKIVKDKPDWKRVVGLLPAKIGVTRAIMAAAIEAKCLSDKDIVNLTPTLEELGLLDVAEVKARWEKALKAAEDMRAANIARNVQSKAVKDKLQDAADTAVKKAVEEVTRNMRIYFLVDISGSMQSSIDLAKKYIAKFLQGFTADRTHIATFNTAGRVITLRHASAAGVEAAFRGIGAGGGTSHAAGVRALSGFKPKDDEDSLFIFVGDGGEYQTFEREVQASGLRPMAFGFVKVPGEHYNAIENTARQLGIPCFLISENTFDDPYAIPRTVKALVASTPVGMVNRVATPRVTLVEQILKTELLQLPPFCYTNG
jgi:hypothetical protein